MDINERLNARSSRAAKVNKLIQTIGGCGRRFFYFPSDDRYAEIKVDKRGRVWWIDEYTIVSIYLNYKYWGKGFSNGGTLRDLVNGFRDYVMHGKKLRWNVFGPWPKDFCNGDLWGYGEDMGMIRVQAKIFDMLEEPKERISVDLELVG